MFVARYFFLGISYTLDGDRNVSATRVGEESLTGSLCTHDIFAVPVCPRWVADPWATVRSNRFFRLTM